MDPGRPHGSLRQRAHEMITGCDLTYIVHGPGTIDECLREFVSNSPALQRSTALDQGIGMFAGDDQRPFIAFRGINGVAVAVCCLPGVDARALGSEVAEPLEYLERPWMWSVATLGGVTDPAVATVIDVAEAVPMWATREFAHLRPATRAPVVVPGPLAEGLTRAGWERLEASVFRCQVSTGDGRTQLVQFGPWNDRTFSLTSPVAMSVDGSLPAILRRARFDDYRLDVVDGLVVLVRLMAAGPPFPLIDEIASAALRLAAFADRVKADVSMSDDY